MGRIKVLISDLDGTLFEAGTQNVRDSDWQAICDWRACGNEFWVATGRRNNVRSLLREKNIVPDVLIYSAGCAYVSGEGKAECRGSISSSDAQAVFDLLSHQFPSVCSLLDLFADDGLYLHGAVELWQRHIHAPMMPAFHSADDYLKRPGAKLLRLFCIAPSEQDAKDLQRMIRDQFAGRLLCLHTDGACVDILPDGCSKWDTAAWLLEHQELSAQQCAAIGDEEADAGMIQNSGIGFAMQKAPAMVKADADYVVSSVAEAVEILSC